MTGAIAAAALSGASAWIAVLAMPVQTVWAQAASSASSPQTAASQAPATQAAPAPGPRGAGPSSAAPRMPRAQAEPRRVPAIAVDRAMPAPDWALAERKLLELNVEAARAFTAKYLDDHGYLRTPERWGVSDGPDDAMENIRNWPLAHALGGSDELIDLWSRAWEGHLEQYGRARIPELEIARDGIFQQEFISQFDWEHTSEGLSGFYFYGLSRPHDGRLQARLRRFSGFYMNEDPAAPNYDPKLKIIKSLFNGSRGPKLTPATPDDWDGPAHEGTTAAQRSRFLTSSNVRGDHPLNLNVANLVFHAYLATGDAKYRQWVLEYVDAWRERTEKNGGNIPSNIGLDGTIGGEWGGKWYGGVFGWNSPDEGTRNYVFRGPPEAFGAALLLTGDQRYTQVMRRQLDNIFAAKKVENGKTLLPRHYGDQGWYGYHELTGGPSGSLGNMPNVAAEVYVWGGLQAGDLARLPQEGWIKFLTAGDPSYPLTALQQGFAEVQRAGARLARDVAIGARARGMAGTGGNAVSTTALINLTMGANDPGGSSHGPLPLHAQVRHFDPERQRAGLPPDVGALVSRITADGIVLTLVNLHPLEPRTVMVQMGAYGEHEATTITPAAASGASGGAAAPVAVNSSAFTVRLAPGAGETFTIAMRRYAHQPSLAFPWDRAPNATPQPSRTGAPAPAPPSH